LPFDFVKTEFAVWIDAAFEITGEGFREFCEQAVEGKDLVVWEHPGFGGIDRVCTMRRLTVRIGRSILTGRYASRLSITGLRVCRRSLVCGRVVRLCGVTVMRLDSLGKPGMGRMCAGLSKTRFLSPILCGS
jgi:hypothetical protein